MYFEAANDQPPLQAGFTAGTKHFKRAVKRNRIKRLLRETYRLNKHSLKTSLEERNMHLAVFFMFTGKELPEYPLVLEKMKMALEKLERLILEKDAND